MKSKILLNTFGLLSCLYLYFFKVSHGTPNSIPSILDKFNIHHPIVINMMIDTKDLMSIVKCMSLEGQRIIFRQNQMDQPYQSYLIFTNLGNFKWNQPTYVPTLVVSRIENENDLKKVDISIGSEVLFLDWFSLKVYESYTVNNILVTRYLGQFQKNKNGMHGIIFVKSKDYKFSAEKRRDNFYGLNIKVGTYAFHLPYGISDPAKFPHKVIFFPSNDTYDITNLITNSDDKDAFFIILNWMETKFNFTAKVYLNMKLGSPKVLSNGSIILGNGAIRDVFEGSVDFLCGAIYMLPERAQFGAFLIPINSVNDAILIPIVDSVETFDWDVFCGPFSTKIWIALAIKCIIFSTFAYIIEWLHNYNVVRHYIILGFYTNNFHL